ncbi:hypothetical protein Q3G72_033930 [Acer saccharum]|nr:hypothetical protein Q3G72_033930 [Acer saccharum]
MQALELGDKRTADRIESLICNFYPDSPILISVYVPATEENSIPDISSPSSFDSDSPVMTRSSKSDVDDHQRDRLHFSFDCPCSFDCEINVVGEEELCKYKSHFDIPDVVTLMLPGDRAAWNPPENVVTIYGAMLSCGVTLPFQPFIAIFLAEAQIAPTQLAPNSYKILMCLCLCLCLMWRLKGYGPPTPREIRHFYTLRQAGNSGTYFLLSSAIENWIPEGVANPGQVEVSSDEKKKGFIWGFPTSNKWWKNSWFFVGGKWGRDVPASGCHNLPARKIPKHFTSPEAWSKGIPVLLDIEISHLSTAAVLPLDERGRSFLLDDEKMITKQIFPRLLARLPRLCDFDTIFDLQARAVKNSEAARKRHAADLAKEGVASPDGSDPSDDEEVGDGHGGGVEMGQAPVRQEVATSTPSCKGKEKVGASRVQNDIPIFDANVPETPPDPASDLNPRTGRGKRPAKSIPDHAVRPPKWVSRVVQYVISSDEEGAGELVFAEAAPVQKTAHEVSVEWVNPVVPSPSEGANDLNDPTLAPPKLASPPTAVNEPNVSSAGQPGQSSQSGSAGQPGPSKPTGVFASASSSGVAHEALPVGSTEADEGSGYVSLSDFSAAEICSHLINNNVCVDEGWQHVKGKSCNRKIEFFFNCHSLMMSELVDNYRHGNLLSKENKRLREQASILAAEKLSAEESYTQQLAQLSESVDGDLKAVLEVEAVDRFKRSSAYDAFLLREFEKGMRQSKTFFAMKDHLNEKALRRFEKSLQLHMDNAVGSIKEQIKRWKAHCCYTRTDPHPMHLEVPTKRAFNTYYSGRKGSFSGSGAEPDLGH